MLASEEARRAVAMTLVTDVALAYVELRVLDQRLEWPSPRSPPARKT